MRRLSRRTSPAIDAWLAQTAEIAAGDNQTNILDQAVAILSTVELHGLQARFGDVHLAGRELVEAVSDAFTAIVPQAAKPSTVDAVFDFSQVAADASAAAPAAPALDAGGAPGWLQDIASQHDVPQPETLLAAVAQHVPDQAGDAIQSMLASVHGHGFELFA